MARPSWDKYFMDMCNLIATRATCDRKHVGAVIVKDNRILSTGYNGSLAGSLHCDDVGHDMEEGHCVRTIHAEVNAITEAARRGISTLNSTLYCNTRPCHSCLKVIISAGVIKCVYGDNYGEQSNDKVAQIAMQMENSFSFVKYIDKQPK